MRRRFRRLRDSRGPLRPAQVVGLIGCGNYSLSNIAYYLTMEYGQVIGGCMDIDLHRAASMSRHYGAPLYTNDAAVLIENGVYRHFSRQTWGPPETGGFGSFS